MAIRTALLNGNNINKDSDFSKYIESVSEPGVIKGFEVSADKVGTGQAFVLCERTNGETIQALVYNTSEVSISGDGDVYIKVNQTYIDDGELANEDGIGIATVEVGTMPSKNALKLATKSGSTITDARNMIKKVGELKTLIDGLTEDVEDLDERVEVLEEAGAIDHLEESGLVGELYTLSDTLFKQNTPTLADSTIDCNIGNTSANTQIHIQRLGSGVASNQLKLKVKKTGSPTQNLIVEVRKGVQVTVTANAEAYWYGNEVIASGSIAYSSITTSYAEYTVTLNNNFGGTEGELLDIVVYQNGNTVNASHYFSVACDSTQFSEGFSYVSVNGNTRTRSKLMPYGISDGFAQSMLCKTDTTCNVVNDTTTYSGINPTTPFYTYTAPWSGAFRFVFTMSREGVRVFKNGTMIIDEISIANKNYDFTLDLSAGDIITITAYDSGNKMYGITITALNNPMAKMKTYPRTEGDIGDNVYTTLYGIHTDNEYYGGIMLEKSDSATTGSITLGNAVGYIKVNLNGEIVKIPYYSE